MLQIGYFIFMVVRSHFTTQSVDQMRESNERATDRSRRALQIGELVKRHGGENWLEPLLDELGPKLQEQAGDLADFLEILIK